MSTFAQERIQCPGCGVGYSVDVADSLHISARPDLREAILDGSFHRFACPSCQATTVVEKMLAYTDFKRNHWFIVFPRADLRRRGELEAFAKESFHNVMEKNCPPMVREWAPQFLQRTIFGLPELREKILVLDAGLDDRVVETYKLQLASGLGLTLHPRGVFAFERLEGVELDKMVFLYAEPSISTENSKASQLVLRELVVERAPYEALRFLEQPEGTAAPSAASSVPSTVVDYRVAMVVDESTAAAPLVV